MSAPAWAADINIDISAGNLTVDTAAGNYTYNGAVAPYTAGADYLIVSGSTTTHYINISGAGAVDITLSGVTIDVSGVANTPAINIQPSATVNLTLIGANTLNSGRTAAGLAAPAGVTLTVAGPGSLKATGGEGAAGIGGNTGQDGGYIIIGGSVQVTAQAGTGSTLAGPGSAGIGGSLGRAGGNVTITDAAQVKATGSAATDVNAGGGAGIGSGGTYAATAIAAGTITIYTTGTVTASGGSGNGTGGAGAPIGRGGYNGGSGAGITGTLTQPANASVAVGATATFSTGVTQVGTTLPVPSVYQWQSSPDGVIWTSIALANAVTYTTPSATAAMNGTLYSAVTTTTGGGLGTDVIAYATQGATLTVTGGAPTAPVVSNIAVPAAITAGQALTLIPPTVTDGGAAITSQGWQLSKDGGATWNGYATGTALDASYNGASLRYCATNSVGTACSANAETITVNPAAPTLGSIGTPTAITAGQALTLIPPTVTDGGAAITSQGWQLSQDGGATWASYTAGTALDISYNGASLRYCATNSAGTTCSNEVPITVSAAPATRSFSGTLVPAAAGTGAATLSDCSFSASPATGFIAPPPTVPAGVTMPYGAFHFVATGCGAGPVTVTLTLPYDPALPAMQLYKYNGTAWAVYTSRVSISHTATNTIVSYTVTDNGAGDNDSVAGQITDPVALGYVLPVSGGGATAVPTLGEWALALLAALLAGIAAYWSHKKGTQPTDD